MYYLNKFHFIVAVSLVTSLAYSQSSEAKPNLDDLNNCRATYNRSGNVSCLFDVVGGLLGEELSQPLEKTYAQMSGKRFRNSLGHELELSVVTNSWDEIASLSVVLFEKKSRGTLEQVVTVAMEGANCDSTSGKCAGTRIDEEVLGRGWSFQQSLSHVRDITFYLNKSEQTVTVVAEGGSDQQANGLYKLITQ